MSRPVSTTPRTPSKPALKSPLRASTMPLLAPSETFQGVARAIADIVHESDPRDVMTSLAPHHYVAPSARPGPGRGVRHRSFVPAR
jgi:hypothetical protein